VTNIHLRLDPHRKVQKSRFHLRLACIVVIAVRVILVGLEVSL
jgi:hypothetical protein